MSFLLSHQQSVAWSIEDKVLGKFVEGKLAAELPCNSRMAVPITHTPRLDTLWCLHNVVFLIVIALA